MEEIIPSYDVLFPEFQKCFLESTQIPTHFDVFDPHRYESYLSLQNDSTAYNKCLEMYNRALSETFAQVYYNAIEGLSFMEFVDSIDKTQITKFAYKTPSEIVQCKYATIANKDILAQAFQKKCSQFQAFFQVYEYAQKIFEVSIKLGLISLEIPFDQSNRYFNHYTDVAIASHCFHKPISLNLKAFKFVHLMTETVEKKNDAQLFSGALMQYLNTGVSPNMDKSIKDIKETVEVLKNYLRFKPHAVFADDIISFADLCSYIAFFCATEKKHHDLVFFHALLPEKYKECLLNLTIKWTLYHILQNQNASKIKEESVYFFTANKQDFMSDVNSRLLFQLGYNHKRSKQLLFSLMQSIDLLFDEPKRLDILKKLLGLRADDVTEIQKIIALHTK